MNWVIAFLDNGQKPGRMDGHIDTPDFVGGDNK